MTFKDWILLLVPIMINGLVVYKIQLNMNKKNEKLKTIENRKKDVINKFINMIMSSIEIISTAEKNFYKRNKIKNDIDKYKVSVLDICIYGENMELILKMTNDLEDLFRVCDNLFNQVNYYESLELGETHTNKPLQIKKVLDNLYNNKEKLKYLLNKAIKL